MTPAPQPSPDSIDDGPRLRLIALPLTRPERSAGRRVTIGIAEDGRGRGSLAPSASVVGLDTTFPPIISPPITLTNHGGTVGSGVPVQLIFWGSVWNQGSTTPSAGAIVSAVRTILAGPYLSGLRQYGVKRCPMGDPVVVTRPGAPSTFDDSDVQDLILALIEDNQFPPPSIASGRRLYCVFMPPGTAYSPGGARGAHSAVSGGELGGAFTAWLAWIGNNTLSQMTSTFCHELAEMCSDPEGDGWTVNGQPSGLNEIGDVCNLLDQVVSGVNMESYWSIYDNVCLIPTAWSLRRTLRGAGKRLDGRGLLSVQRPIPSLNRFVVDL